MSENEVEDNIRIKNWFTNISKLLLKEYAKKTLEFIEAEELLIEYINKFLSGHEVNKKDYVIVLEYLKEKG